jgi:predicted transposase YbfD/YdcC
VAERSNEIVAIPPLLDMMAIEGAIVTIDAMGGQRDIAQRILNKTPITCSHSKAIKALCEDVEVFFAEQNVFRTAIDRSGPVSLMPFRSWTPSVQCEAVPP